MDRWVRVDADEHRSPRPSGKDRTAGKPSAPAGKGRSADPQPLPADVATAIRRAAEGSTARHREALVARMERAVAAYDHNRYQEAARLGGQLVKEVGQVPAVRRLAGFANYRFGRWREAVRQFDAYLATTEDAEVLPALMDCHRALGRHKAVVKLWAELRHAAPDADVVAEARIVAAGSLADRGDLSEAIEVLTAGGAARSLRNPSDRHLRQWYALADLYERAGDVPRARTLFTRVAVVDPEAYDVAARLAALGPERRSRPARASRRRRDPAEPKSQTT
jgi:tetratricopeptide (TPR) repeat protein